MSAPESSAKATGAANKDAEKKWLTGKTIVVLIILVLALIFIFSNLGHATLHFLGFQFVAPGWIWFLALLAAGVVIGSIFPWFRKKKR